MRNLLDGVRVLDFTQIGAGPTCGMLLADFGADVVKVEGPAGDIGRTLGPPWYGAESPIHLAFNRGKRSLCVDLKAEAGLKLVRRMAERCDVLVESFRPGVMARFGLGYDDLRAANPGLVYCAVSGYGQDGPYADRAGVDGIIQAASGLTGLIGLEGIEPCKVQAPIVDVFTGYVGALGVLGRLLERTRTGVGGFIDVNLFASAVALQQSSVCAFLGSGEQPEKIGSAAPYSAPNEAFRTEDGWIMVAAYIGPRWERLCRVLERPDLLDDTRFATSSDRVVHRPALREELGRVFAGHSSAAWITLLEAEDILCSKVADYADLLAHPQLDFLRLVVETRGADGTAVRMPGNPINSREMNRVPFLAPPGKGEHTAEIWAEFGLDEAQAARPA